MKKAYLWVAGAVFAIIILIGGACYWTMAERAEARQSEVRSFLQGVLAVGAVTERPIRLRVSNLPGSPPSACTVRDYNGIEELRAFLGPQRFDDFARAYRMGDHKSGLVLIYDKYVVAMDSTTLPFSTARTACLETSRALLVVNGRNLELQAAP